MCSSVWVGIFRSSKVFNIQNASSLKLMRKWRSQQPSLSASPAFSLSLTSLLKSQGDLPGNQVDLSMKCEYCKGGRLHSSLFFFHAHKISNKYLLGFRDTPATVWGMQWWARHMPFPPLTGNAESRKLVCRLLSRVRWRAFRPRVKNRLLFMNWAQFVLLFANRVHLVQNSFSHYKTCGQRISHVNSRQISNCLWVRACMILVWRDLLCKYIGQPLESIADDQVGAALLQGHQRTRLWIFGLFHGKGRKVMLSV